MKPLAKILKWGAIGLGGFIVIAITMSLIFGKPGYRSPETLQQESQPEFITAIEVKQINPPLTFGAKYRTEPYTIEKFISDGLTKKFILSNNYDDVTVQWMGKQDNYGSPDTILTDWKYNDKDKNFILGNALPKGSVITFMGKVIK